MREGFAGFLSVVAAAAAPATAFAIFSYATLSYDPARNAGAAFLMAFIVAFGHALILGLPTALALVHKRAFRAVPMLVAGACVGLFPAALLFLPYQGSGWVSYSQAVLAAAGLGSLGGVAFYFTHQAISPRNTFETKPFRGSA